jgi:hypothetical protein
MYLKEQLGLGEIFALSSGAIEAYIRPRCVDAPLSDW